MSLPPFNEGDNNATTYSDFLSGLLAAPSLKGINLKFGYEFRYNQTGPLPYVCFWFTGGRGVPEKFGNDIDPTLSVWKITDNCVFEMWAASSNKALVGPVKVAADQDAVGQVVGNILQALEYQRTNGLRYGRGGKEQLALEWVKIEETSFGRGARFSTPIDIMFTESPPILAEVNSTPIDVEIVAEIDNEE